MRLRVNIRTLSQNVAPLKHVHLNTGSTFLAVSQFESRFLLLWGFSMLSPTPVRHLRKILLLSAASLTLCSSVGLAKNDKKQDDDTQTPIKHVVVIIPENQTFDHYFGTYPNAANIPGEQSWLGVPAPNFVARKGTPEANIWRHRTC